MKHQIMIVCITTILCTVFADTSSSENTDDAYIRFIGGLLLLRTTPLMANQELRITRYRELLRVTGITALEASGYLSTLRNDPDAGITLYDVLQKEISLKPDTTK
jgi:hypothetical protein